MSAAARSIPVEYVGDPALFGYPAPFLGQHSFDCGPSAPVDFTTGLRVVVATRGNPAIGNANPPVYLGHEAGHFVIRDRDDVDATTKGVGYALSASIVPKVTRGGDVPWADFCCLTLMNRTGVLGARGTDMIYGARNGLFGSAPEFGTLISLDTNADKGLCFGGTLGAVGIDMSLASITSKSAIRLARDTYIRAVSSGGDERQLIGAAVDDSVQLGGGWARIDANANVNIQAGAKLSNGTALKLDAGWVGTKYGNVSAATYPVAVGDFNLTFTAGGCVVTLPSAASFPYRELWLKTTTAGAVTSASANVVPLAGGALGTAILPGVAGSWAKLVADSAQWQIMAAAK